MPPTVYQVAAPTNGMATAALVLGILSVVLCWTIWLAWILGILAIVFGAVGRSKANQGAPNGRMALAGLILGIAGIVLSLLLIGLLFSTVDSTGFQDIGVPVEP